ncbi:MAG: PIG-L family deacetylase [Bacteroidia bacterium]|nr:PIG-L family deacetylase [Bacteroidia bacterium]
MNKIKQLLAICSILGLYTTAVAQKTNPSSEILQDLHRLKNTSKVLYIAAHPDDENTRLISYLTQVEKANVSYLSLTRGDGGQNLIGTEIGEELGLIRTQELVAARRVDGGRQYFTRAVDFGYSKTPEETFNFWDKEQVLADVVWVIRQVQPDIIITRFSPEVNPARPTHGHHTASAQLALEAFTVAADPNRYTDQLEHVKPWQTKKIYWNTSYWFYGTVEKMDKQVAKAPDQYLKIDVNQYIPLLGKSGSDISAMSRSQHKSQGFGSSPVLQEQWEYLQVLDGTTAPPRLFDELPVTWKDAANSAAVDKAISKVMKGFDVEDPSKSVEDLFNVRDQIEAVDDEHLKARKLEEVNEIILKCLGFRATAFTKEKRVTAGQKIESKLEVLTSAKGVILKEYSNGPNGDKSPNYHELIDNVNTLTLNWTVPEDASSQPYWLRNDAQNGMYVVNDLLNIGKPGLEYPFNTTLKLEVGSHELIVKVPLLHSHTDPVKGQVIQPLLVTPKAMMNLAKNVYVFTQGKSKIIDLEVVSGSDNLEGYAELLVPDGWKVEPSFYKTEFKKRGDIKHFSYTVTPPEGQEEARIRAIFKDDSDVFSMGVHQLDYDHIPNLAVFPSASSKVVSIDLKKEGERVAYIMGAGDKVPASIREMGYAVDEISINDVLQNDLSTYDAVVLGIRALNTIDNIGSTNDVLSAYVEKGGNLIMQYNTSHRLKAQPLGPAVIKLSRNRVTEEDAKVDFVLPQHRVLNTPNKITTADFDGWVQERGLYFPSEWDKEMEAILSMHDTGEEAKLGSLLVGKHGDGYIVYTGLSFFREVPAGVPGAYRLLANILSL